MRSRKYRCVVAVDRVAALCAATVTLVTLTACGDVALVSPALTIPDQLAAPPASQSQQGSVVPHVHATRAGSSTSGTDSGGSPAQPVLQFLGGDLVSEEAVIASPANLTTTGKRNASWQIRQLSLRPRLNVNARDPMDHWGHRQTGIITLPPMEAAAAKSELTGFLDLLKEARGANPAWSAPDLRDEDTVTVLGQDMGVTFGRWSAGPADTLSIKFNLDHTTKAMRNDPSFRAMLERAGKVWSYRIDDTWLAWEREAGEPKATLIGNNGEHGKRIEVGPGGETSTGLVIYVTGFDENESAVGLGGSGPYIIRPGHDWEPHTGVIAFKNSYVSEEGSNSSRLFSTMAHEIGHVLGSWQGWLGGDDRPGELTSYMDSRAGTWTGPNVVAVHGGPAPFQDENDPHRWRDKHSLKATRFDFGHSGVCDSLMAYCSDSTAQPTFLPAEIDFAFLADVGLSILPETDRPETYGVAGWLDHAAFLVSVSRELDVSLADDSHYSLWRRRNVLDTTDLLWAEAHVFGHTTATDPTRTLPNSGTVRYNGGLLGVAVDQRGMPPVSGTASIQLDLSAMTGRASFSSLVMAYAGKWYRFGDGNLHYSLAIADDGLRYTTPGISLAANFYGPEHEEIAGTLDDSRAGLLAGFGAGVDNRPIRSGLITKADYVRGQSYVWNHSMFEEGWRLYRCGTGNNCESKFKWWEPESQWHDIRATNDLSKREHVLSWTAGWGDQMSEDVVFDDGAISISRRYASDTDGGQGQYQADGYYGTMNHAAFGTGFHGYHDWDRDDGSVWDFKVQGTGVQGKVSNSQPPGSLTWEGRLVGYQSEFDLPSGSDPFVKGRARVTLGVGFGNDSVDVDIDFDWITSMDGQRTLAAFGFRDIKLRADGTFAGSDDGLVGGAFFGPAHEEVAGTFYKNSNEIMGSFGAVNGN